ncbi:MAG: hypothetical protein JKX99_03975 [Robiginitomaculum sp.]|nr:hypothetical protein [Robiginitomaculum sp.]
MRELKDIETDEVNGGFIFVIFVVAAAAVALKSGYEAGRVVGDVLIQAGMVPGVGPAK